MMISEADILGARVLIVDDQESNVSLLEQLLSEHGYTSVSSTMNPHEVCTLHRRNRYDLILLDLQMPGMDGFEVMEGLKTNAADGYLPVLVITAQPGHQLRAQEAGWNEPEGEAMPATIAARQPFLDFVFSRVKADASLQKFQVSGEPMFNRASRFIGYRGIGVELTGKN